MDALLVIELFALGLLLIFSGLFSASEAALLGLGRLRLANLIERGGKAGQALEIWQHDPNRLLTTILILNNAINIAASTIAAFFSIHLSELLHLNRVQMGALTATGITLMIIVFGEVIPKVFALQKSEKIALIVIRPLVFLAWLLQPLSNLLVSFSALILKPFGIKTIRSVPLVTEEEIHALIQMGADQGVLEDEEHQMIHGVIRLGETQVREVMVPRTDMECINAKHSIEQIINQIIQVGYSRMPVYKDHVDNIVGVVYTKDIIHVLQDRELIVLQDILRKPYFVPETKKVDELLREFQKGKLHMAIVVDEYGGTSGLVTLEDLIEEIVGEIQDEYDTEESTIVANEDGSWMVDGRTDLWELGKTLDLEFAEASDLNTIGGFLTDVLGYLPKKGEQVRYQDFSFTIVAATERKIQKIRVEKTNRLEDSAKGS
jgi:gliding motility-associated protein GldE